jgi:hypothetical protein
MGIKDSPMKIERLGLEKDCSLGVVVYKRAAESLKGRIKKATGIRMSSISLT